MREMPRSTQIKLKEQNMSFKKLSGLTLACAMALGAASAQAGLVVSLYDGATTITIADNQVGDLDPSNNNIAYFGSIGVWTYSFSGAISSAPDGQPGVHFTSADSSSESIAKSNCN